MPRWVVVAGVVAAVAGPAIQATAPDAADASIQQFLAQSDTQPSYRAVRRLEARNGARHGWLEAVTEYAPDTGFRYHVTAEGGADSIRTSVLRAVLDSERDIIARGEAGRSSLIPANYTFEPSGVDADGLVTILLSPRRKERVLVSGRMLLQPADGRLVQLQGRLAKSPSFWIKNVDIVRSYEHIEGVTVPVSLESTARLRLLGIGTLRMSYTYSHINGRRVG